jgi:XTP/dITP diphosphohydrolase
MTQPVPILAATANRHKLAELRGILAPLGIPVLDPAELGGIPDVEETGTTFTANAILKATTIARHTGRRVFADDSGLEVFALGGEPGIYSARYAPTDAERIAKLLGRLPPDADRAARFVCVIAVADPEGLVGTAEGEVRGAIGHQPRGRNGFGYDPIFIPAGFACTLAELTAAEKDRISHRGHALRQALQQGLFTHPPVTGAMP